MILILIICGLFATFALSRTSLAEGAACTIIIDGKHFGTYSLSEDRTIDLKTGNIVTVKDGYVYMESADCNGQDCIHQGKINRADQDIVCLPHKVIIEIEEASDEYDTISK